ALLLVCGVISTLAIILIFFFLFKEGIKAASMVELDEFLYSTVSVMEYDIELDEMVNKGEKTDIVWQPASDPPRVSIVPLLWGSFGVAFLTALISTLAGVAAGTYLSE